METAPRAPGAGLRRPAAVVGALVAAWVLVVGTGVGGRDVTLHVSNLGQAVAALAAAALMARRARRGGASGRFWALMAVATCLWGAGQTAWSLAEAMLREVPFPSVADVGYIGCPIVVVIALGSVARHERGAAGRARLVLDGLLIAGSLLLISWITVLGSVFRAGGDSPLAQSVALAYPVLDVLVLSVLALLQVGSRRSAIATAPFVLTTLGVGAISLADSAFAWLTSSASYTSSALLPNGGWVLGFALLALAALDADDVEAVRPHEVRSEPAAAMIAPYAALLLAFATSVGTFAAGGPRGAVLFGLQATLSGALMARQLLAILENRALTRTLERRVLERTVELGRSERRFRALALHSSEVVSVVAADGHVLYQSESIRRVFGYQAEAVVGTRIGALLAERDAEAFAATIVEATRVPGAPFELDALLRRADGVEREVSITVTSMLDDPAVEALVLNVRDVTEERTFERELRHQAFHDPLTSLANRALFRDRLEHALTRRDEAPVHVFFIDLDRFKDVNDTLGHGQGDALLVAVAARLSARLRPVDTLARLGGDEFAVLLERGTPDEALDVAVRLLGAFDEPFPLGLREPLAIGASLGVASALDAEADAEALLRNADLAMYRAKAERSGYVAYEASMHRDMVERLAIARDLTGAIAAGAFFLEYQPTVALADGALMGVEALVRWRHPELGVLGPGTFIPVAEQEGLIGEIGGWVLAEACRQAAAWHAAYPSTWLSVNVNVASGELHREDYVEHVAAVLARTGLPPGALVLELTETSLVDDLDRCAETLGRLRALGARIAIDDFGSGYSSLNYVRSLPIDIVKIDRAFVTQIDTDERNQQIVEVITSLAATLELSTVAEGVESATEAAALRRLGCDLAQGYHLGRPMAASDIAGMLDRAARRAS